LSYFPLIEEVGFFCLVKNGWPYTNANSSHLVSPVHLRKKEKEKEKKTLCSGKIANETTFSIFFIPLRGWKSIL